MTGFPDVSDAKESACNAGDPSSIPGRRKWQPTPLVLPGKPHELRSFVDYSPWSHKDSDMTEVPSAAASCVYKPFAHHLQRNSYSSTIPVFT